MCDACIHCSLSLSALQTFNHQCSQLYSVRGGQDEVLSYHFVLWVFHMMCNVSTREQWLSIPGWVLVSTPSLHIQHSLLIIISQRSPIITWLSAGRANGGKSITLDAAMPAEQFSLLIKQVFPALGTVPFRLCRAVGPRNELVTLQGQTPRALRHEGLKKSALYIQPLEVRIKTYDYSSYWIWSILVICFIHYFMSIGFFPASQQS